MSPSEFIFSAIVTWTIILVPPAIVRAVARRPLRKISAWVWVVLLFIGNFAFFAWLTGTVTERFYLFLGAFASFYVLTWQSSKQAKLAVLERRRAMGYDANPASPTESNAIGRDGERVACDASSGEEKRKDGEPAGARSKEAERRTQRLTAHTAASSGTHTVNVVRSDPMSQLTPTRSQQRVLTEDPSESGNMGGSQEGGDASRDRQLDKRPINWPRGFMRLWLAASLVWAAFIGIQTAAAMNGSPYSGWFVDVRYVTSTYQPDDAQVFLRGSVARLQLKNDETTGQAAGVDLDQIVLAAVAPKHLSDLANAAYSAGIPRLTDPVQIAEITGLSIDVVSSNLVTASQIAAGLKLVEAASAGVIQWPKSFDTRTREQSVDWVRLWAYLLGVPLLLLIFGLTLRWIALGLMSPP